MAESFDLNPPHSAEVERAVLGAMFLEKDAIGVASELLARDDDSFHKASHSLIFRALTDLSDLGFPVDQVSVTEYLRDKGTLDAAGGEATIAALSGEAATAANIRHHCQILRDKSMLRKLIKVATATRNKCFKDAAVPDNILDDLEQGIMNLADLRELKEYAHISEIVHQAYQEVQRRAEIRGGVTGVSSGFHRLDRLTAGWQKSDLIILAGRPSMGKTALALEFVKNAAMKDHPVGLFSLEMSTIQLTMRLLFNEARFNGATLHERKPTAADFTRLSDASNRLAKYPIYIDDTPGLSSLELSSKARRLKKERHIELLIVDYLQLMQGTNRESRTQEISSISRSLKMIAKNLNIPVIALSQLSRAVELRKGDRRPVLSDLRESGAIEQDADVVMFIYRSAVYDLPEDLKPEYKINDVIVPEERVAELILRKQRNGPVDTVLLQWTEENTKFDEFDYSKTQVSEEPDVPFG